MVPKAKDKARSKSTVLEPDLIHCSIVSSKTKVVYMCSSLLQLAPGSRYLKFRYFEKATKVCPIFHLEFDAAKLCQIKSGRWEKLLWPSQNISTLFQAEKRITVMQSLADSKNGNYIFLLKMTTLFI